MNNLFEKEIKRNMLFFLASLLIGWAVFYLPIGGLSTAGKIGLSILTIAVLLWTTEAIPLYITSFIILILEVVLLGLPKGPLNFAGGEYAKFFSPFFSPVIVLFLVGFVLAAGLQKYELGKVLINVIINKMGNKPERILLGAMLATAFSSMWISNTAATAAMIAVIFPLLQSLPKEDKFRKALILGITFSASIGGMATPIGTPPNAIAIGALEQIGYHIDFSKWVLITLPLSTILFFIAYRIVLALYPATIDTVKLNLEKKKKLTGKQRLVLFVGILTAILWLSGKLHGIPSAIVALLPMITLFGLGLLKRNDFSELGWNTLIIIGGGLSLGVMMQETGLSSWVVSLIKIDSLPLLLAFLIISVSTLTMATFISHSAVANLIVPIVIGLSASHPLAITVACALAASSGMALPVSTPPNAIAYSTGEVNIKEMAKAGTITSLCCAILISLYIFLLRSFI